MTVKEGIFTHHQPNELFLTPINLFDPERNKLFLNNTHESAKVKTTRRILDELNTSLKHIKIASHQKYVKNGNDFQEGYFTVVDAVERILMVFENIKSIPLVRNIEKEDQRNDGSYIYSTKSKITLPGKREKMTYKDIGFFIRPEPTSKKEARSALGIEYTEGTIPRIAKLRIDQDKITGKNVFDLFIFNPDLRNPYVNMIDILDLEEAGQRVGHHFNCNLDLEGVPPSDIHNTIKEGLDRIIKKKSIFKEISLHKRIGK